MYYTPRVNAAKAYPVDDAFFPPVSLSESQLAALRAEAAAAINKTLAKCGEYQRSRGTYLVRSHPPWKLHAEHNGLYEYKRSYERYPNVTASRVFGTIQGNYMDVANLFKTETRKEYFNAQKILFPWTVDAAVLWNISPRHPPRSRVDYEGIKLVACDPFLLRVRMDSCHYETMDVGTDGAGKPYAYRVILSLNLPEVPDLFRTKRTVRMSIRSVMIFRSSDQSPNATELFACLQTDYKGHRVPTRLSKQYLVGLQSLGSSSRKTVYKLAATNWIPNREGCSVCSRSFSMLRSKGECSNCLSAVCRKCLVRRSEVCGIQPTHKRTDDSALKLCTSCVVQLRQVYEKELSTPLLGDHVPSLTDSESNSSWSGRRSNLDEWVGSPTKPTTKMIKKKTSRCRVETATSLEDELLSSRGSCASSTGEWTLATQRPP